VSLNSAVRVSGVAPVSGLIGSRQQRDSAAGMGAEVLLMVQGHTITRLPVPLLLTAAN